MQLVRQADLVYVFDRTTKVIGLVKNRLGGAHYRVELVDPENIWLLMLHPGDGSIIEGMTNDWFFKTGSLD